METLTKILFVALGGALGAVSRYAFSASPLNSIFEKFPFPTFLVNIIGSFLIMNLFVGAVVDTFNTVKKENLRSATLSDSQQQFVSSMREMLANKPKPVKKA